jgi:hypothetical protein
LNTCVLTFDHGVVVRGDRGSSRGLAVIVNTSSMILISRLLSAMIMAKRPA